MGQQVRNYGEDNVKTLSSLEHIRFRPSMYIKSPATVDAQVQLVKEMLDNTTDEVKNYDKTKNFVTDVAIFTDGDNYQIVVIDRGRGVPIGAMKACYTVCNTSGKYELGGAYTKTTGTNGVGIKATTGLADRFIAISKRINGFGYLETAQGKITALDLYDVPPDKDKSTIGTVVLFEPDFSILTDRTGFVNGTGIASVVALAKFTAVFSNNKIVLRKFNKLIPNSVLNNKNPFVVWAKIRELATTGGEVLYDATSDGALDVVDYVRERYELGHVEWGPMQFVHEVPTDRTGFNITLFATKESRKGGYGMLGAVNLTEISVANSSHISVLQRLLKGMLSGYLADEDVRAFFNTSYKLPVSGAVMVEYDGASYENQTKDNFRDTDFEKQYAKLLQAKLNKVSEAYWEQLYELIKQDIADRYNRYANQEYRTGKSMKNIGWTLFREGIYTDCSSKDASIRELFVCEGDSAGDQIAGVRNTDFQAVFRLKGKPINGARSGTRKMCSNKIIQDLITIINVKPTSQNLDDMHFSKLIVATDADADGHHIASLVVTNLLKLNPLIVEQGKVYVALPPLYALKSKNPLFIRDERAHRDARIKVYEQLLKIDILMGGRRITLHGERFRDFCCIVMEVSRLLEDISRTLVIDEDYLELLVHCVDYLESGRVDTEAIKTKLGLDSATYYKDSDTLVLVSAGAEIMVPVTGLVTELQKYLLPLLRQIHWDQFNVEVSTRLTKAFTRYAVSFSELSAFFKKIDGEFNIRRFKGLGEMPDAQLEYTCVNPLTRCMIQIHSSGDVDEIYQMMGANTNARKGLIDMGILDEDTEEE